MTRMLILATFSLAATTLPLPAQTPNGPVQGAVQGTVKGTAMVGQGVVQGTGQAGQGYCAGICQRSERCWSGHCRSCKRRGHGGGQDRQRSLVHCNSELRSHDRKRSAEAPFAGGVTGSLEVSLCGGLDHRVARCRCSR